MESELASSACSAGPGQSAETTIGSRSQSPTYVFRRVRAECRWLIPSHATVVVRYVFGSAIVVPARRAR